MLLNTKIETRDEFPKYLEKYFQMILPTMFSQNGAAQRVLKKSDSLRLMKRLFSTSDSRKVIKNNTPRTFSGIQPTGTIHLGR